MIDIKGPEGKVRFRFFHKAWSSYEDEDDYSPIEGSKISLL